jgi:rubrerythrin
MALLRRVKELIGDGGAVYECRRCGTTLESDADTCPQCGKSDIAAYDIG